MELAKTHRKPKLDKEFSFPVGVQVISDCLASSTYWSKLEIHFTAKKGDRIGYFTPGWTLRKLKGKSNELLRFYCQISCKYSAALDKWTVTIYPNKKQEGAFFRDFIITTGLQEIKNWLDAPKTETWFEGSRYLQIGINQELTEYCTLETFNDKIIEKKASFING